MEDLNLKFLYVVVFLIIIINIHDLVYVILCTPYKNVLNGALEALYRILVSIFHK